MSGVSLDCANCGIVFCLPVDVRARRLEDHKTFWCPNGHANHFPQESKKEATIRLLRRDLDWAKSDIEYRDRRIAELESLLRSRRAALGAAHRKLRLAS